ncbi:MAG TPA: hypothetical protein VKD67_12830 [Acidimicrobiales bacterium]|nr:hypothetical protein [Acidimicrobiales bacterium]
MLFEAKYREPIASGAVDLTFRRWKRSQAVVGHRYRTPAGRLEVDAVDVVASEDITDDDARRAGQPSAAALVTSLRGPEDGPVFRVRFHAVTEPDERDVLAADDALSAADRADIDRRLDRLDRASPWGPWTRATLEAIADHPGVRAPDLAASFGRETAPFKLDVRKLKALGLTISLRVGYRLSPRGESYLSRR